MNKKTKINTKIHFRKRNVLELMGLFVLLLVTYLQWGTIQRAFREIIHSEPIFIILALVVYWLALPLTAISYRLLSDSRLRVWTTTLAQLSGSGPGRIIPGGLGRLSLSVVHLMKLGYSSSRAIVITMTSNIIGIMVNVVVLCLIVIFEPEIAILLNTEKALVSVTFILLFVLASLGVFRWLRRARKTRKTVAKLIKKWNSQIIVIRQKPILFVQLSTVSLLILGGNVIILLLSSYALKAGISATDALIALSVGVLIGGVLPTPGGIGGVEAGIASSLVFLGYGPAESTSIALLFRAITYWQPLLPGTIAYFYLRRRKLL